MNRGRILISWNFVVSGGGGGIDDDARKKLGENTKEMKRDGKGEIVDSYEICFNIILERKLLKKNCNFEFIFNPGSG